MTIEEKTKKWGCYHCSCCRFYHGFAKGCELPGCAYILVSFAQQEIEMWREIATKKGLELEKRKQKLQQLFEAFDHWFDPLPIEIREVEEGMKVREKLEELLRE